MCDSEKQRAPEPQLTLEEVNELWRANRALLRSVEMAWKPPWKDGRPFGFITDSFLLRAGWSLVFVQAFELLWKAEGKRPAKVLRDARNRIAHAADAQGLIGRSECHELTARIEARLRAIGKLDLPESSR
jgi:hypothetical protein